MEKQQSFSHGLLYSVAPENIYSLHLLEEDDKRGFDWDNESLHKDAPLMHVALDFLKTTAVSWGIIKPH